MALEFIMRRRAIPAQQAPFTPDPFPIEPDPEALQQPAEVIGDEGGGGISAGGQKRNSRREGRYGITDSAAG